MRTMRRDFVMQAFRNYLPYIIVRMASEIPIILNIVSPVSLICVVFSAFLMIHSENNRCFILAFHPKVLTLQPQIIK